MVVNTYNIIIYYMYTAIQLRAEYILYAFEYHVSAVLDFSLNPQFLANNRMRVLRTRLGIIIYKYGF